MKMLRMMPMYTATMRSESPPKRGYGPEPGKPLLAPESGEACGARVGCCCGCPPPPWPVLALTFVLMAKSAIPKVPTS